MNSSVKLPHEPRNPMQEALDGWHQMRQDLMVSQDQNKQLIDMNNKLLSEVDFLRAEIERKSKMAEQYGRYAIEIRSRLGSIKDIINKADSEAQEYAIKPPVPNLPELPPDTAKELERVISNLPPNSYPEAAN